MSDGNFNRALLPHTPYQSGLKVGKAMARKAATDAFKEYLKEQSPTLSDEALQQETERFARLLAERII